MLPDRVSNPGPLTYESGALPIALRGLALLVHVYRNIRQINIVLQYKNQINVYHNKLHYQNMLQFTVK